MNSIKIDRRRNKLHASSFGGTKESRAFWRRVQLIADKVSKIPPHLRVKIGMTKEEQENYEMSAQDSKRFSGW